MRAVPDRGAVPDAHGPHRDGVGCFSLSLFHSRQSFSQTTDPFTGRGAGDDDDDDDDIQTAPATQTCPALVLRHPFSLLTSYFFPLFYSLALVLPLLVLPVFPLSFALLLLVAQHAP